GGYLSARRNPAGPLQSKHRAGRSSQGQGLQVYFARTRRGIGHANRALQVERRCFGSQPDLDVGKNQILSAPGEEDAARFQNWNGTVVRLKFAGVYRRAERTTEFASRLQVRESKPRRQKPAHPWALKMPFPMRNNSRFQSDLTCASQSGTIRKGDFCAIQIQDRKSV